MSLLLDALKQAEEEKKKRGQANSDVNEAASSPEVGGNESAPASGDSTKLSLEPMPGDNVQADEVQQSENEAVQQPVEPVQQTPELKKESNEKPSLSVQSQQTKTDTSQQPTPNVLAAGRKKPSNNKAAIVLIALLIVGVLGFAVLNYMDGEQQHTELTFKERMAALKNQAESKVTEIKAQPSVADSTISSSESVGEQSVIREEIAEKVQPASTEQVVVAEPEVIESQAIQIKKTVARQAIVNQLQIAYTALVQNDLPLAERTYAEVLKRQPEQVDALLGMANLYLQNRSVDRARAMYEKALEVNPTSSIAQIGLMETYQQQDVLTRQQVLKELVEKYPNTAELYLALGHAYAEQNKWRSAQEAYFEAFSKNPSHVTSAYNLAVSLDQLGQYAAAKTYYQKALSLNAQTINPIDLNAVKTRLQQLGAQ